MDLWLCTRTCLLVLARIEYLLGCWKGIEDGDRDGSSPPQNDNTSQYLASSHRSGSSGAQNRLLRRLLGWASSVILEKVSIRSSKVSNGTARKVKRGLTMLISSLAVSVPRPQRNLNVTRLEVVYCGWSSVGLE